LPYKASKGRVALLKVGKWLTVIEMEFFCELGKFASLPVPVTVAMHERPIFGHSGRRGTSATILEWQAVERQ